jgi:hypothetical protein
MRNTPTKVFASTRSKRGHFALQVAQLFLLDLVLFHMVHTHEGSLLDEGLMAPELDFTGGVLYKIRVLFVPEINPDKHTIRSLENEANNRIISRSDLEQLFQYRSR